MIQRIQTVYFFLAAVLAAVGLCTPVGRFVCEGIPAGTLYNLWLTTAEGGHDFAPWALFAILLPAAVLSLAAIFLFKRRMLQVRLSIFCSLLLVGYYVAFALFAYNLSARIGASFSVNWTAAFPAVALILHYLAFRAVMRDEMMVRALDRLR